MFLLYNWVWQKKKKDSYASLISLLANVISFKVWKRNQKKICGKIISNNDLVIFILIRFNLQNFFFFIEAKDGHLLNWPLNSFIKRRHDY